MYTQCVVWNPKQVDGYGPCPQGGPSLRKETELCSQEAPEMMGMQNMPPGSSQADKKDIVPIFGEFLL